MRKGIILAGGEGTRLRPLTRIINKHLLPVYDKPMILYPLETLKNLGITDIMIVSGGDNIGGFAEFLGDGSDFGVNLTYRVQTKAGGIAQALSLAKGFTDGLFVTILGDNIFENNFQIPEYPSIYVKRIANPERFGVYYKDQNIIIEKPKKPTSDLAVTGLYVYDDKVFDFIEGISPSARGELEITDVNNLYLEKGMRVVEFDGFWSDAGTLDSIFTSTEWAKNKKQ